MLQSKLPKWLSWASKFKAGEWWDISHATKKPFKIRPSRDSNKWVKPKRSAIIFLENSFICKGQARLGKAKKVNTHFLCSKWLHLIKNCGIFFSYLWTRNSFLYISRVIRPATTFSFIFGRKQKIVFHGCLVKRLNYA